MSVVLGGPRLSETRDVHHRLHVRGKGEEREGKLFAHVHLRGLDRQLLCGFERISLRFDEGSRIILYLGVLWGEMCVARELIVQPRNCKGRGDYFPRHLMLLLLVPLVAWASLEGLLINLGEVGIEVMRVAMGVELVFRSHP